MFKHWCERGIRLKHGGYVKGTVSLHTLFDRLIVLQAGDQNDKVPTKPQYSESPCYYGHVFVPAKRQ